MKPLLTRTQKVVVLIAYLFHVVPVGDDSVFNRVFEGENSSLGLSFIADVRIFLAHAHHHALMPRAPHDGGEDGSGSVISGKSGLRRSRWILLYFNVLTRLFFAFERERPSPSDSPDSRANNKLGENSRVNSALLT